MAILRDSSQKGLVFTSIKIKQTVFKEPDEVQNPKPIQNDQDDQFKVKSIGEPSNYPSGTMQGLWTGGQPIIYDGKEYIPKDSILD